MAAKVALELICSGNRGSLSGGRLVGMSVPGNQGDPKLLKRPEPILYVCQTTLLYNVVGVTITKLLAHSTVGAMPKWVIHPLGGQINQLAASDLWNREANVFCTWLKRHEHLETELISKKARISCLAVTKPLSENYLLGAPSLKEHAIPNFFRYSENDQS